MTRRIYEIVDSVYKKEIVDRGLQTRCVQGKYIERVTKATRCMDFSREKGDKNRVFSRCNVCLENVSAEETKSLHGYSCVRGKSTAHLQKEA